MYIIYKPTVRT